MPALRTTMSEVCGPKHVVVGMTYLTSEWIVVLLFLFVWLVAVTFGSRYSFYYWRRRSFEREKIRYLSRHYGRINARDMSGRTGSYEKEHPVLAPPSAFFSRHEDKDEGDPKGARRLSARRARRHFARLSDGRSPLPAPRPCCSFSLGRLFIFSGTRAFSIIIGTGVSSPPPLPAASHCLVSFRTWRLACRDAAALTMFLFVFPSRFITSSRNLTPAAGHGVAGGSAATQISDHDEQSMKCTEYITFTPRTTASRGKDEGLGKTGVGLHQR